MIISLSVYFSQAFLFAVVVVVSFPERMPKALLGFLTSMQQLSPYFLNL